ncbi:MAG: universal stress protein [Bacteroidetes bacterium]|nr:universal stress protein [Bacteroidota bacterium]
MIKENKSVLIPIDFSKQSLVAVKQSYSLAKKTKSKLILLHVSANSETENKDKLEQLADETRAESGLTVETLIIKASEPYDAINKQSEELKCSMVFMGLDENTNFKTGFFGGGITPIKLISNSPCPVVTIRGTEVKENCKNIVMPFDLTPESREKVSDALQIANYYESEIKVVSVFPPDNEEYENKLLPYVQQVKKFIKAEGINCGNKSIPSKTPAEAIIDYALKNDTDLIIQTNQRDLSIGERFSGTVGARIVELSSLPVLNINPMKRESMSHFSSGM